MQTVNPFPNKPWFLPVCSTCLFPHCFRNDLKNCLPFSSNLKLSSANSFSFEESKIGRLGKGKLFTILFQLLISLEGRAFENTMEKGKDAGNQHFLLRR